MLTTRCFTSYAPDLGITSGRSHSGKLLPFAQDRVEVWRRGFSEIPEAKMFRRNAPRRKSSHQSLTRGVGEIIKTANHIPPENLPELTASDRELREGASADAAFAFCRDFSRISPQYCGYSESQVSETRPRTRFLSSSAIDELSTALLVSHGSQEHADTYIQGAEKGLGPRMVRLHNARGSLALCCVFMTNFTGLSSPSDSFRHTILDAEYLTLLHFANALATNETGGTMAPMCRWLYGDSRTTFSTGDLDAALPTDTAIRNEAYCQWERGRTHGRADTNWFWAKTRLQRPSLATPRRH